MIVLPFASKFIVVEDVLVLFGNKVRETRKEKGLSQERLAELAGLDRSYMGRIERGEKNISLTKLYQISHALDVSPADLLI